MLLTTNGVSREMIETAIKKAVRLFECYREPPVIEGTEMTNEYLSRNLCLKEDNSIELSDSIVGGIYGDVASQLLDTLFGSGAVNEETIAVIDGKNIPFDQIRKNSARQYAEMSAGDAADDPDSACFRGRGHLLDNFWEGCIEQSEDCSEDD